MRVSHLDREIIVRVGHFDRDIIVTVVHLGTVLVNGLLQSDPDLTAPDLAAPRFNGRINFPQKFFGNFLIFEFSN